MHHPQEPDLSGVSAVQPSDTDHEHYVETTQRFPIAIQETPWHVSSVFYGRKRAHFTVPDAGNTSEIQYVVVSG